MTFIIIGKRKPTREQPKAVTVVWDGTHEGSLLIGRAKFGTRSYCEGALESLRAVEPSPVVWTGIVEVPEEFGK